MERAGRLFFTNRCKKYRPWPAAFGAGPRPGRARGMLGAAPALRGVTLFVCTRRQECPKVLQVEASRQVPPPRPAHEGVMFSKQDRVRNPWTDTRARLEDERVMLHRIATGMPLDEVMDHVLRSIEQQSSVELITSIAFVDEANHRLRHGVAPGLPAEFVAAIDGAEIAPDVASWGAAAYFGSPVYIDDIAVHPNWQRWRDLALKHGLRACWSTPIKGTDGGVLGVFSNYYRVRHLPSPSDIDAMALVTRMAALAIERHRTEQALRDSSERWRGMFNRMQEGFFLVEAMRGADGKVADFRFLEVNPAFEQQSGLQSGDTLGHSLREMIPGVPDLIMETFINVVESGESAQFELAAPHQGREAWYEARVHK